MLFAIIGTIDRGNFIFDRWPRIKQFPKIKNTIPAGELSDKLTQYFYYFGLFRKNSVFQTSQASFSESCMIQIFNANEKRLQVVLGIDDECVMVSRSVFIANNEKLFNKYSIPSMTSNLYSFEDLDQEKKDIVNSITLVWRGNNFQEVQQVKNKLSFMIGVLRHMEHSEDYLTKQIIKITEAKDFFDKKIKQKCSQLNKDVLVMFQEYKVKEMFQEFYDLAEESMRDISIFKQISKFYNCCATGIQYIVNQQTWQGSVGSDFKVPLIKKLTQRKIHKAIQIKEEEQQTFKSWLSQRNQSSTEREILLKATLATQKKLQMLPKALLDQRILKLYNSALRINDASLEDILEKQKSLSVNGAIQTIEFLRQNGIGLTVYPFDLKKYYSLYTLRKMPNWALIKKFNAKIFPNDNILRQIHSFSKFKRINSLNQKLKYIILQGLIKQVYVYIYYIQSLKPVQQKQKQVKHFCIDQDQEGQDDDSEAANRRILRIGTQEHIYDINYQSASKFDILMNYVNKPYNLNQILREGRYETISEILKLVIQKMEKKKQKDREEERETYKQQGRKKLQGRQIIELNTNKKKGTNADKGDENQINKEEDPLQKPKWGFYYVEKS